MAKISKENAQRILEKYGYKVVEYIDSGACSQVFKCVHPKDEKKFIAVKLCQPDDGAWASLDDEIYTADELEVMEKDIEKKINNEKDPELKKAMKKHFSGFFKYMTKPKRIKVAGQNEEFAIFEAELADSDVLKSFRGAYLEAKRKEQQKFLPHVNYPELRRVAKDVLKGLRDLHREGKIHGDIKPNNILKKFDTSRGKNIYSLTDFGTMKSFNVEKGKISELIKTAGTRDDNVNFQEFCKQMAKDIWDLGYALMVLWWCSLGWLTPGDWSISMLHDNDSEFEKIPLNATDPETKDNISYPATNEDKAFLNFCKKLTHKDWKERPMAKTALEDPFIKNK